MNGAAVRTLSLGAGVQSTTLLLLACDGSIPPFDVAVFADTGWEPKQVYTHLQRLTEHAARHGIPVDRVASGNIRDDALDPRRHFASMPLHVRNPDGTAGLAPRQCTAQYKLKPIKRRVRQLLGYPHPAPVPADIYAEQAIGISVDEIGQARDSDVRYLHNVFPLLDLGWTRKNCQRYLTAHGWTQVAKSACIGCPFHGNRMWRELRDHDPDEWADAVAFDHAIRHGTARARATGRPLRGQMYLHRSHLPLDHAPIDRVTRAEWHERQGNLLDLLAEHSDPDGCSPWTCRNGQPVIGSEDPSRRR